MKFLLLNSCFAAAIVGGFIFIRDNSGFFYFALALLFLYIIIIAIASFIFRLNFFINATHKGKPGTLALTFDDGPHPVHTPAIIEILKIHHVKAAFFLIGKKAEGEKDLVRMLAEHGHLIGNHSFKHSNLHGFLPTSSVCDEIENTNNIILQITGQKPVYYRPPFGVTNPNIASAVKKTGMTPIGWDLRSYDTITSDEKKLFKRITKNIRSSTILLMHDSMPVTVKVLPQLLDFCKTNGIEIVPLNEVIKSNS